ncbi:MAG: hypothetical protein SVM86_07300 [Candidatus Cloacimonadota bacterium]|nr:hypothetical protein [Candidatus Cloacimonadota bacterium]
MLVKGSIKKWQEWTGMEFKQTADYIIPGTLNPIKFDIETNYGEYVEPNVWVEYNLGD